MSIYTSESVCSGHPDKICDQISDAILDEALRQDPYSRVAVETMVSKNICVLMGEVTTRANLDFEAIARNEIKKLGYVEKEYGFYHGSKIIVKIHKQSPEIALGVDQDGAGDQGMMYGYACKDTKEFMPMPIELAHKLAKKIDQARTKKIIPYLKPDGKTQVSIEYKNNKPVRIDSIVVAVPHSEKIKLDEVRYDVMKKVIIPTIRKYDLKHSCMKYIVNGTGEWHNGGPASDSGVTGRKIVVDTYGGIGRIGGGAFSGKDPTKVDRSGAYAARFIAKNIVANNLADKCEVRIAYFIGAKEPIMKEVETFGTNKVPLKTIKDFIDNLIDLSVKGIINKFDLRRPIYLKTAAYGHFGRLEFKWEKVV